LTDLLPPERQGGEFTYECSAGGSVKDLIEGLGVPHTEVDLVLANGRSVDFAYRIADGDRLSIYPVFEGLDIGSVTMVRAAPLREMRFVADVHLGRLASYLRLCGFDTLYRRDWTDEELASISIRERRVLLTCDRGLLKRAVITHGYLIREHSPRAQLSEVLERFDLCAMARLFSRCSMCNGAVEPVAKGVVNAELPRRTAEHYEEFWRCLGCGRVYWRGAHYQAILALMSVCGGASEWVCPAGEERDSDEREDSHGADADRSGGAPGGRGGQRLERGT
jgi:uncharacterized protein with PIN domain